MKIQFARDEVKEVISEHLKSSGIIDSSFDITIKVSKGGNIEADIKVKKEDENPSFPHGFDDPDLESED